MPSEELLVAEWSEYPFTSIDARSVEIRHRILVNAYPGVGADIRHEIRADENELVEDGWLLADAAEVRDHGVRRVESDDRWWSS